MLVERPDYRIDSRTIKRGSQVSNLIASLWRAQTFAYLTYHLSCMLFGFYPCENLELVFISIPSSSSSKTDFINILLHFYVGGFTGLSFLREAGHIYAFCSYLIPINSLVRSLEWRYLEYHEHNPDLDRNETLGQFIQSHGYSPLFQKAYLVLFLIWARRTPAPGSCSTRSTSATRSSQIGRASCRERVLYTV